MNNAEIIGFHSSRNGSFCYDCFSTMITPDALATIERVASYKVWQQVQETYTISRYDAKNIRFIGDVVDVIRDDSEDIDRQNMDDYPQGLVCKSKGCDEVIVARWEDDGNFIHFANGVTRYGLVYKIGHGPIDWNYATKNDDDKEVVLTDVMSGGDDYYEIDTVYEQMATIRGIVSLGDLHMPIYIHDRDSFYVKFQSGNEPVELSVDGKWQFC